MRPKKYGGAGRAWARAAGRPGTSGIIGHLMAHDVFISYSSKDKPTADAVCATLEARGIRCWVAPRDILPGTDWGEAIIDAIEQSRVMILIFSGHANESPQIKREVERAVNKNVTVVPLRIENVPMSKSLEYFVSTPHGLDALTPPLEQHLRRVADTLQAVLSRPGRITPGMAAEIGIPPMPPVPPPGGRSNQPPAVPMAARAVGAAPQAPQYVQNPYAPGGALPPLGRPP